MIVDKNVPEIRFKGFSGEWNKKILGELVQLENGFAFQSKYFKKNPTEVIVLTPGSVNIGGGFQAGKGQYHDVKQDISPKYVFKPDDMFITMTDLTPTAQALGFPAIIPRDNNTYLHNQRLGKLVGFQGDSSFLYNLLRTLKKQKEVVLTSSGTTVKHTSSDKFLNRFCLFPKCEEQTQIGNYFQKLDNLINQHRQKHGKLSNIKKAMLGKMFPKQGETVPEILFKGFSGKWGEVSLSDFGVTTSGTSIESEFSIDGKYIVISIGSYSENSVYTDQGIRASLSAKTESRVLNKNDLTMILNDKTLAGNIIGRVLLISADDSFVYNQRTQRIEPFNEYDPQFLYQFLNAPLVRKKIFKSSQGNTQIYVNWSAISKLKYFIPKKDEQTAIGSYFQKLDALINQHQQQITKLNNIKQACLRKMFV